MVMDVLLEPMRGEFDVKEVSARLSETPHTERDASDASIFIIARDEATLEEARAARRRDASRYPTTLILIDVSPQRIEISYRSADPAPAREFVHWLSQRYDIRFMDEEFNDLTERCRHDLNHLFGSPREGA